MNRRSFLRFAGLAPIMPGLAIEVMNKPKLGACTLLEVGEPVNFPGTYIEGKPIACEIAWDDNMLPAKETVYTHSWTPGIDKSYTFKIDMNKEDLEQFKKLFGLT